MARLGKFTGTVYSDDYDFSRCPECCLCLTDEQANDPEFLKEQRNKSLLQCVTCFGCPAACDSVFQADKD